MSAQDVAFIVLGGIGSLAAIRLVTSHNVVHAALYLVVTLAMVGAVYLLVAAEFVAWVQVLIYVGAIVVLVLFSLMLTKVISRTDRLRFLRAYMRWNLRGNDHWKKWWRAIARATEHKIARNQRRGRPIS